MQPMSTRQTTRGSILPLLLIILSTMVVMAAAFVLTTRAERDAAVAVRQRSVVAQVAHSALLYAGCVLANDYAAVGVDGRTKYPPVWPKDNLVGSFDYKRLPYFPYRLDATGGYTTALTRADLAGSAFFTTFLGGQLTADASGVLDETGPTVVSGEVDPTRPPFLDTCRGDLFPVFSALRTATTSLETLQSYLYANAFTQGQELEQTNRIPPPRWITVAHYDRDMHPLGAAAAGGVPVGTAYTTRMMVQAQDLCGTVNLRLDEAILAKADGGLCRMGPGSPAGTATPAQQDAAKTYVLTSIFHEDYLSKQRGEIDDYFWKRDSTYPYPVAGTGLQAVGFDLEPAATGAVAARFPLAQQYAAGLCCLLQGLGVTLGGGAQYISVRKDHDLSTSTDQGVCPVSIPDPNVSVDVGYLLTAVNVALGQGMYGNRPGYLRGSSKHYAPVRTPRWGAGPPMSSDMLVAMAGKKCSDTSFATTDFQGCTNGETPGDTTGNLFTRASTTFWGSGLRVGVPPLRAHGSTVMALDGADIDCPWYINAATASNRVMATVVGSLNPGKVALPLLPIPPDKGTARWDDGVLRSGMDGCESGGWPSKYATPPTLPGYTVSPVYSNGIASGTNIMIGTLAGPGGDKTPNTLPWRNPSCEPMEAPLNDTSLTGMWTGTRLSPTTWQWTSMGYIGYYTDLGNHVFTANDYHAINDDKMRTPRWDDRLSYDNDLSVALSMALADLRKMQVGRMVYSPAKKPYEKIEDLECAFLSFMGIAVNYTATESHASTQRALASDYVVYPGTPADATAAYPWGCMNQLRDMSRVPETLVSLYQADASPPAVYAPTWADLTRLQEHRINDYRMSLFGTPALDLNIDGTIDATTQAGGLTTNVDGTAATSYGVVDASHPQAHFSMAGRLFLGRSRYWRLWVRGEVWHHASDRKVSEQDMEGIYTIDPNGDGNQDDNRFLNMRPLLNVNREPTRGPSHDLSAWSYMDLTP